jgi:hypothetical protein
MAAALLAMLYLAWGAILGFWPGGRPDDWALLDLIHWAALRLFGRHEPPFHASEAVRWNWGLLAAFYAATLVAAGAPRVRRRTRPGAIDVDGSPAPRTGTRWSSAGLRWIPPAAELVLALWLLLDWLTGSRMVADGLSRWLCLVAIAALLVLAVADWRPRPRSWRLSRFAVRVAWLAPASIAGAITGLAWTAWGWQASLGAALLLGVAALFARIVTAPGRPRMLVRRTSVPRSFTPVSAPIARRRRRIIVHLLAAFWWFAMVTEFEKSPAPWMRTADKGLVAVQFVRHPWLVVRGPWSVAKGADGQGPNNGQRPPRQRLLQLTTDHGPRTPRCGPTDN